ncbi:Conserved_hypothetical protein [Hexamita inflata]|uniref:Uncharacterized protein n=1 Tax=Hexamita inflata TaxID=28002 RepID=A0AA86R5Q9_9EUKA|nr:Conserved hypothetical protein [Hexamita inflata]
MQLLLSSILFKSVFSKQQEYCNTKVTVGDQQYIYCQKAKNMQQTIIKNTIQVSQSSSHMFIYTDVMQNSEIQVEMNYAKVFAVFGFNKQSQTLQHSIVNISLNFEVIQAALICIQCDLYVLQSSLIFKASGQIVSGVMLQSKEILELLQCNVQYRFNSMKSSGLINQILVVMKEFTLIDFKLSGDNKLINYENGYFVSVVNISNNNQILINTQTAQICVEQTTTRVGNGNALLSTSTEILSCLNICDIGKNVYGFCLEKLVFGQYQLFNDSIICVQPFQYNGEFCECAQGFILNLTSCVNIVSQLTNIDAWLSGNFSILSNQTSQNIELTNKLNILEGYIIGNVSDIHQLIFTSFNTSNNNLVGNISVLSQNIDSNSLSLQQQIYKSQFQLEQQINQSSLLLDQRIFDNQSALTARIQVLNQSLITKTFDLNSSILIINSSLSNISQFLTTSLVSLNGNLTSLSQSIGSNITKLNQTLIDLTGTIQANVTEVNSTLNLVSDLLKTSTQSLNISLLNINSSLSDNISLLSSKLSNLNTSFVSNLSVINQTISQLNNTLLNNISLVNLSMLQKMSNLLSNISTVNTTLTNSINASNVKIYQMINTIADLQKQIIDLNQADLDPHIDISDDFSNDLACVQQPYINSFDILVISNSINAANFTGNYVFGDIISINNAFIDVSDSSFSTSLFYLFKSQSYYYNMKIQVGTQVVGSGSIVSDSGIQLINKLSIISNAGSSITIQSSQQLNILQRVSSGLNIRGLFLNLTLSSTSVGSFDLVETASGALNIRNYQVLGTYYSSQSSCIGALKTNTSQILLQQINFNPTVFTFGNMSSYMFCQVNFSTLLLQNIVVQVGASDVSSNIITSISTSNTTDFAFGGIAVQLNYSQVDFKTSVFRIYASYNTQYINNSGQMFGLFNKSNTISVSQICYQDSSIFQTSSTVIIGVIGYVEGNLSFSRTTVDFNVSGDASFQSVGTIAFMTKMCVKAVMSDLNIQLQTSVKTTVYDEFNVSALVGRQNGLNWTVQNSLFKNILLTRGMFMGIVAGICENSVGSINNIQIEDCILCFS